MTMLGLQAAVGNQVVQRLAAARALQREGDVIHMDQAGVGHKEPDKSKTPDVIHMDQFGVGHKEPDKSKAPAVMYVDQSGVGHDDLDVATALNGVTGMYHKTTETTRRIVDPMVAWPPRLLAATTKRDEAAAARNTGMAVWDVEAADSGEIAAKEATKAEAAAAQAKLQNDATAGEVAGAKAAETELKRFIRWRAGAAAQFSKDRARWLKSGSSIVTESVKQIQELIDGMDVTMKGVASQASTIDSEAGKIKAASDEADALAKEAWSGLSFPPTSGWSIVGMLQQKLNAMRAPGAAHLPIHALLDSATQTAMHAFQNANGIAQSDRADVATWAALDAQAPSIMQNGKLVVESRDGAQLTTPLNNVTRPMLKFGDKGAGVKEIQQRLNNWRSLQPGAKKPFKELKVDGSFGFADKSAVKIFQTATALKADGIVGPLTWGQLEQVAGAVAQGTKQFDWRESVEGITNVGTTAGFDWEAKNGKLTITVKINFTGSSSHPMVNQWLQDIKDVWNNYKAVEQGVVGLPPREFPVDFNPVKSSSGFHKVRVAKPTKKDPNPRSDSGNWYVNDTDKGLAPHEFGHLIGLEDEYNRPEEQAVAASGLEATVGQTKAVDGTGSTQIADNINNIITTNAAMKGDDVLGLILAELQTRGVEQGAFARLIAKRYEAKYGFNGQPDMSRYLAQVGGGEWTSNLTWTTQVFLVSNKSLMGTMGGLTGGQGQGTDFSAIPTHQHPVQPRHIRAFANLLSEAVPGTTWKPKQR